MTNWLAVLNANNARKASTRCVTLKVATDSSLVECPQKMAITFLRAINIFSFDKRDKPLYIRDMKKITNFFKSLQFIFQPNYWIMLGQYDKEFEESLLEQAEKHSFEPLNCSSYYPDKPVYNVRLGNLYLWVGNYPHSFFKKERLKKTLKYGNGKMYFFWRDDHDTQLRPSRLVIKKLYKKLVKDLKKHNKIHA